MLVDQASEISVHSLVPTDELVGEGESWHQSSLLQPEDGTETSREEDSLDTSEGNYPLGKTVVGANPTESPLGFLSN